MRFTIRDLLWLTVVVALAVGWWIDRGRLAETTQRYEWTQSSAKYLARELENYGYQFTIYPDGTISGIKHDQP